MQRVERAICRAKYTYEEMEWLGLRGAHTVARAHTIVESMNAGDLAMRSQRNLFHLQRKTRYTMLRSETRQKQPLEVFPIVSSAENSRVSIPATLTY